MSRTRRIAVIGMLVGLVVVPAVAFGSTARSAANSTTYPDSIAEDAAAPDITSTTVSNDDNGTITFHVGISNRPALTPDMLVAIVIDSDNNPATGDTQGIVQGVTGTDYLIQLVPGEVDLFKWNGTDYIFTAAASLVFAYDATGATIKIRTTDLGNPKTFAFAVLALSGLTVDPATGNIDPTNAHRDASPDPGHGAFTYNVQIKVSLSVVAFTATPKPVKAGLPFSVGLAANESDTGAGVQQGAITCVAKLAGKGLRITGKRIVNGIAVCAWKIPKTAKGKRIQGSITLSTQGAQVSRAFSLKIA